MTAPCASRNAGNERKTAPGERYSASSRRPAPQLPGAIPPHDSAMTLFEAAEATRGGGIDMTRPLVAFMMLATGERVRSS